MSALGSGDLTLALWVVIIGMAAVTLMNRAGLLLLSGRFTLPPGLQRALRYAPCAALSAICLPDLLTMQGQFNLGWENVRFFAGAIGLVVAILTRSTLWTLAVGMVALHLLKAGL